MRQILWVMIGISLAACQAAPGATEKAANPIEGAAIETSSLDAPAPGKDAKAAVPDAKQTAAITALPDPMTGGRVDDSLDTGTAKLTPEKGKLVPKADEKPAKKEAEAKPVLPAGEGGGAAPTAAQDADRMAAEAAVKGNMVVPEEDAAVVKSETQLRCEKKGGVYAAAQGQSARTCVKKTRDAGKTCSRDRDCQGQCLARSGTCAPIDPLLGCNEVLQNNGVSVTLCIE